MEETITDQDRVRIVSDFILHAPPGELNEVFNDVRVLLKNDALLKEAASSAFAQYNKDQLTPARLDKDTQCLITEFNDLGKDACESILFNFPWPTAIKGEMASRPSKQKWLYNDDAFSLKYNMTRALSHDFR